MKTRISSRLLAAACLLLAIPAGYAHAEPKEQVEEAIRRITQNLVVHTAFDGKPEYKTLDERMKHYDTPGVSVAVVEDFKIHWARGFGVKEQGKPAPVTESTLFQAASLSKPIFAIGVMRLVEAGQIDLDDDVNNILTSWKLPNNGEWSPLVTLRQLLSHSAGTTVAGFPGYAVNEPVPNVVQVLNGTSPANTDPVEVNTIPGIGMRYSGGGTTVAQLAVTDRMEMPFPAVMEKAVFEPLGLRKSTYQQSNTGAWAKHAATGHLARGRKVEGRWHVYPEMAAAGLRTTPSDLATIGIELQKILRGDYKGILKKESVEEMLSQSVLPNIGIGFFLAGDAKSGRFHHGGRNEGFLARILMFKESGQGFVVMMNSDAAIPLIEEIERAIAMEYDWPGYDLESAPPSVPLDTLKLYVGNYKAESGLDAKVTLDGEKLFLAVGRQQPLELVARTDAGFKVVELNSSIAFRMEDSKTAGLSLNQGRTRTEFVKQ